MSLLSLQDIQVAFGAEDVLTGVSGEIDVGDRIGLVGRNGAGKTTLLHVLAGELQPSGGKRHIAGRVSVAVVDQVPREETSLNTVLEEAMSAFAEVLEIERQLEQAAHDLSDGGAEAAARYSDLQEQFEHRGGYHYQNRLTQVLTGLGLPMEDWNRPVNQLSGGQRSRLGLAKALLSQPDLLILDEPTNHIDIDAMRWLDDMLARWPGTLVITSHDRYFLDKVANRIWSLEDGRIRSYRGNYSQYEVLREAELDLQQKKAQAQQEYIAKEEAFIRRYRAGQKAREAQGRLKKLSHIERIEAPRQQKTSSFRLAAGRSGDLVLSTRDLAVGYGTEVMLRAGTLEVERGQRIALIGANGSGKTTLLKTIAGELTPVSGSARSGARVQAAHYWQEAENLDGTRTVLEEVRRDRSMDPQQARNLLGRFLFSGDDVNKPVSALSGGERSRLALAKLMLDDANLLLLDEPTNHLDIPARKSLEDALSAYEGTIIFVSHDRRLIADLATDVWNIEEGHLQSFHGTFAEYLERSAQSDAATAAESKAKPPVRQPPPSNGKKPNRAALAELEKEIELREREIEELGHLINESSAQSDHRTVGELGLRFEQTKSELDRMIEQWAALAP
ncbi:MAG TPA: ABC-F family ATP-binding cassette domain-containing protein [Dehalococcoidia bacterium]|nr:ABC-F family ATP-binding cassette domain-containing protein [Dehalococcoidia bacterium]